MGGHLLDFVKPKTKAIRPDTTKQNVREINKLKYPHHCLSQLQLLLTNLLDKIHLLSLEKKSGSTMV